MTKLTEKQITSTGWQVIQGFSDTIIFARNSGGILRYGELKKGKFRGITAERAKKYDIGDF